MTNFETQRSKHTIDGVDITFSKLVPTIGDTAYRRMTITTVAETITVDFTEDGFELLKAIVREY